MLPYASALMVYLAKVIFCNSLENKVLLIRATGP